MAQGRVTSTEFDWYINTGTFATPTWTAIEKVKSWSVTKGKTVVQARTTDDAGAPKPRVTAYEWGFDLEYQLSIDDGDNSRPAGQAALEAADAVLGDAGEKQFQIQGPNAFTCTFLAVVDAELPWSGPADGIAGDTVKVTLLGSGPYPTIA